MRRRYRSRWHLEHRLERLTECSLAKTRQRKLGLPLQVGVAEHELDGLRVRILRMRIAFGREDVRLADTTLREDDVGQDLDIEGPVAWIMEDEDGGNGSLGEIDGLQILGLGKRDAGKQEAHTFVEARSTSLSWWKGQTLYNLSVYAILNKTIRAY